MDASDDHASCLRGLAGRLCTISANSFDISLLALAVVALCLASLLTDDRESLLFFPLITRSAEIGGVELRDVLAVAAGFASSPLDASIKHLDTKRNLTLADMGYVEEVTDGGIRFRRTW